MSERSNFSNPFSLNMKIRTLVSLLISLQKSYGDAFDYRGSDRQGKLQICIEIKSHQFFRFFWESCLFDKDTESVSVNAENIKEELDLTLLELLKLANCDGGAIKIFQKFLKLAGQLLRSGDDQSLDPVICQLEIWKNFPPEKPRAKTEDAIWEFGYKKVFETTKWDEYSDHPTFARFKNCNSSIFKLTDWDVPLPRNDKASFSCFSFKDWANFPDFASRPLTFICFQNRKPYISKPTMSVVVDKSRLTLNDIPPALPQPGSMKIPPNIWKVYVGSFLVSDELANFHIEAASLDNSPNNLLIFTQKDFIHEIAKVGCGEESAIYKWDDSASDFRLTRPIHVDGIYFGAVDSLCNSVVLIGKDVCLVRKLISQMLCSVERTRSNTISAFLESTQKYLTSWISEFGLTCRKKESLAEFGSVLNSFSSPLRLLKMICEFADCTLKAAVFPPVYELLQFLYDLSIDVSASNNVLHVALFLLQESIQPFIHFANDLAIHGRFFDPFIEFGVDYNNQVLKVDFWNQSLIIRELPRCFLLETLESVVRCGRCLMLVAQIQSHHPIICPAHRVSKTSARELRFSFTQSSLSYRDKCLEETDKLEIFVNSHNTNQDTHEIAPADSTSSEKGVNWVNSLLRESTASDQVAFLENWHRSFGCLTRMAHLDLVPLIGSQQKLANAALMQLMRKDLCLNGHLTAIHGYFFLGFGEFAASFTARIFEKATLSPPKSWLELSSFLRMFEPSKADQALDRSTVASKIAAFCERSAVSVISKDNISYDISDFLGLLFEVEWPLNLVITPDLIDSSNFIFRRLLKLKGALWAINEAHFLLTAKQNVENACNQRTLSIYRHEIGQILRALESNLMEEAVATSWQELQMALPSAENVIALKEAVAAYVKMVSSRCLLDSGSKISKAISEMCRYALRFCSELQNGSSFSELRKTYLVFQRCTLVLFNCLKNGKGISMVFDPENLFIRADYSEFFKSENKTINKSHRSLLHGTL